MHSKKVERRWILLESIPCLRIVSRGEMKKIRCRYESYRVQSLCWKQMTRKKKKKSSDDENKNIIIISYWLFLNYYALYIVWRNWYAVCTVYVYNLDKEWISVYIVMGASVWSFSARDSQIRCNNVFTSL